MRKQVRPQQGFALILVIWALVLLISLASGFSYALRHEVRVAADLSAIARSDAAATAALHTTVLKLSERNPNDTWLADGQAHRINWPNATINVQVTSESGRIDINRAPHSVLLGLFTQFFSVDQAEALTAALLDWRDSDNNQRQDGAERSTYAKAGRPGPANGPFTSVHELRRVIGFDPTVLASVAEFLTVYSGNSRIDAASAGLVSLLSVPGINRETAEQFIARRNAHLDNELRDAFRLLRRGHRFLNLRSRSDVLSIEINVRLDDGFLHRERSVIRLAPTRGFTLIAHEAAPIERLSDGRRR